MENIENKNSKRFDESNLIGLSITFTENKIELIRKELKTTPLNYKRKIINLLLNLSKDDENK